MAWLSLAFGFLATLLASIGLYGITSFSVARRTQEIGIRMALGAARGNVLRLVMREVVILAAAGLGAGIPVALALGKLVESPLFEMKAGRRSHRNRGGRGGGPAGFGSGRLPSRPARHANRSDAGAPLGVIGSSNP